MTTRVCSDTRGEEENELRRERGEGERAGGRSNDAALPWRDGREKATRQGEINKRGVKNEKYRERGERGMDEGRNGPTENTEG